MFLFVLIYSLFCLLFMCFYFLLLCVFHCIFLLIYFEVLKLSILYFLFLMVVLFSLC